MTHGAGGFAFPVRAPAPRPGVAEIVFVCHANQCRSPYLEAIARRTADPARLGISSAGLIPGGHPMPQTGQEVGAELGFDFRGHLSREIDLADVGGFDLVLTAAREQARELVAADPHARARIFTVKQFARWIAEHPRPRRSVLGSWLDAAAADRPPTELLGRDDDDDIADPLNRPAKAWRRMVDDVTPHVDSIVAALR
jgi:protein-tyrosine-phosphatase